MANQIEFKAGSGISLSANAADKSITIATTDPAPSTSTPLALNRGGTGVTDLTTNHIAGIQAADTLSDVNRVATMADISTGTVVNSLIGNESDKAPSVRVINERLDQMQTAISGNSGVYNTTKVFNTSQTWVAPATGYYKFDIMNGGGGGGAGRYIVGGQIYTGGSGGPGGLSSIVISGNPTSHGDISVAGGGGGGGVAGNDTPGAGGVGRNNGSAGYINSGGAGGVGFHHPSAGFIGGGGRGGVYGGAGGGGGGSGYLVEKVILVNQGQTIAITVGAGGAGGNPGAWGDAGGNGAVVANYNV